MITKSTAIAPAGLAWPPFLERRALWREGWLTVALLLALALGAHAQRSPHTGFVYPAGGQQGASFQAKLAGQYLDGVGDAEISGTGVEASLVSYIKPLNGKQINLLRDRLQNLQQGLRRTDRGAAKIQVRSELNTNVVETLDRSAAEKEVTEIRAKLANPKNRRQENPQLAEDVTLSIVVATNAEPGVRELRLRAAGGLSNPVMFHVGQLPEFSEQEPNNQATNATAVARLPAVLNGQIAAGDVDRFRLRLSKGTQLVVCASARELMPYLADAVPGWFQATLALYDGSGKEVAYDDDFRFNPDPVLHYVIPRDGDYTLEIKDAIYRGREDFIYRVTVGELPFVTSIFPLGGPAGAKATVELHGWNLPSDKLTLDVEPGAPRIHPITARREKLVSNPVPFAADALPEALDQEPNNAPGNAQAITAPLIVNGRIDKPGDQDVFRFSGRAGEPIVAEVSARRLNSPLDSVLRLTDANGRELAQNDDHDDRGAGLTTHHADSLIIATLPADGTYYLYLADSQQKGGEAYAYRLRISPPQPDFELRVVPSSINARPGGTASIMVYALRKDGFTNEITLSLKGAPPGFRLSSTRVPATNEQVKLSLSVPFAAPREPVSLNLEGRARIDGREVVRAAVPAEDMMQAFIYRHLVPAQELRVAVLGRGRLQNAFPGLSPPQAKRNAKKSSTSK